MVFMDGVGGDEDKRREDIALAYHACLCMFSASTLIQSIYIYIYISSTSTSTHGSAFHLSAKLRMGFRII